MAILGSLWTRRLYGLEILRLLERNASLGLAEGTLYVILNRLKTDGQVEAEWVDAGTGHPRKNYSLTPVGRTRLRGMARVCIRVAASLETLPQPAPHQTQP